MHYKQWWRSTEVKLITWNSKLFGPHRTLHKAERALRVLEEAAELAQSAGVPQALVTGTVDIVYSKPPGTWEQELSGVLVTTIVAGAASGTDCLATLESEIRRIHRPEIIASIKDKQIHKLHADE